MSRRGIFGLVLILVLVVAACSEETRDQISDRIEEGTTTVPEAPDDGGEAAPEEPEEPAPEPEEPAPEPEEPAPEPEEPEDDEGLSPEAIGLLLLILGLGLVIILLAGRRKTTSVAQVAPAQMGPQWRERAGRVYADARWIHDNAGDETAMWRAAHRRSGEAPAPGDRVASVSMAMDDRTTSTINEVYQLEASATTPDQRDAARRVSEGLRFVQTSFGARVSSHEARLAQADTAGADLARADEAAAAQLGEARRQLAVALDQLAATM
jgi:hypothetical protein